MSTVDEIVEKFYEKNNIDSSIEQTERYLLNFRERVSAFINNNRIKEDSDLRRIVEVALEFQYKYYSEKSYDEYYIYVMESIKKELKKSFTALEGCVFAPIFGEDVFKYNSSNHILSHFINKFNISNAYVDDKVGRIVESVLKIRKYEKNPNRKKDLNNARCEYKKLKEKVEKRYTQITTLILIDDFCGSGNTIIRYLSVIKKCLPNRIQTLVFCLHSMQEGVDKIEAARDTDDKIKGLNFKFMPMNTSDKFFCEENESLFGEAGWSKSKDKTISLERAIYGSKNKETFLLGYNDSQALVTTYRNTPNNTLRIFWDAGREEDWTPLFQRGRVQNSIQYNEVQCQTIRREIWRACRTQNINSPDNFWTQVALLLYINDKDRKYYESDDNTLVNHIIEGYNKSVLQDCLDNSFIIAKEAYYLLSPRGEKTLRDLNLISESFATLSQKSSFDAEDKLKIEDDYHPPIGR